MRYTLIECTMMMAGHFNTHTCIREHARWCVVICEEKMAQINFNRHRHRKKNLNRLANECTAIKTIFLLGRNEWNVFSFIFTELQVQHIYKFRFSQQRARNYCVYCRRAMTFLFFSKMMRCARWFHRTVQHDTHRTIETYREMIEIFLNFLHKKYFSDKNMFQYIIFYALRQLEWLQS